MQRTKGISLIVLVITIIVMIILATVIIISLNNSGIIEKAGEAVEKTDLKQMQSLATTLWGESYIDYTEGKITESELIQKVKDGLKEADENYESKYTVTVTTNGVTVELKDKNVNPWVVATVDGVPIPKGFAASPYGKNTAEGIPAENTKAGGLVIYELTEEEMEKGATSLPANETQHTSWTTRNQYVWVPVDSKTFDATFVRKDFGMAYTIISNILGTYDAYWEVLPTTELNADNLKYMTEETLQEVQAMYASVKKYGGFYIARYETGIDTQRTAKGNAADLPGIKEGTTVYSVMGKIPYTYVPWTWNNAMNEDTNGAVEVARKMYPNDSTNTTGVVSTLTYGVQWDRAVQWFIDTGAMTLNQVNKTEGSTAFGNYTDHVIAAGDLNKGVRYAVYSSSLGLGSYQDVAYRTDGSSTSTKASGTSWALSTGALKDANVNNIYDMAGNMEEWTMEGCTTNLRAFCGGNFCLPGSHSPVAYRDSVSPSNTGLVNGFRSSLYIK